MKHVMILGLATLFAFLLVSTAAPSTAAADSRPVLTIPVHVFLQAESGWDESEIMGRLAFTNEYYSEKCAIELVLLGLKKDNATDLLRMSPKKDAAKFSYLNPGKGIFVIFTGRDTEYGSLGYAWRRSALGRPESVNNTIYMFSDARFMNGRKADNPESLPHEFGHVLLDEAHGTIPGNLMAPGYLTGLDITEEQCSKMRSNLRNGLLF